LVRICCLHVVDDVVVVWDVLGGVVSKRCS
jgi:hypothetical protein